MKILELIKTDDEQLSSRRKQVKQLTQKFVGIVEKHNLESLPKNKMLEVYKNEIQQNLITSHKKSKTNETLIALEALQKEVKSRLDLFNDAIYKHRFPNSADKLFQAMEHNNATLILNSYEKYDSKIFRVLDSAIQNNRIDFANIIIDTLLFDMPENVKIENFDINVYVDKNDLSLFDTQTKFYSRLNEYRLQLHSNNSELIDLVSAQIETEFLLEQIQIIITLLAKHGWQVFIWIPFMASVFQSLNGKDMMSLAPNINLVGELWNNKQLFSKFFYGE